LLDAIDSGETASHREELGDVLLQVMLQSRIREEQEDFDFDDVAGTLADKLIRRHPHVFGEVEVSGSDQVLRNWEKLKAGEKEEGRRSLFEGIPRHLPALQKAQRVQSRAARVGFDWERVADVADKVREELGEVEEALSGDDPESVREEVGDLLFAAVNLARFVDTDAEDALRRTVHKFIRRFGKVEARIRAEGRELAESTIEEMDAHWNAAKADGC
jgi:tetrapyrrole methylase family protein/MazG family protein